MNKPNHHTPPESCTVNDRLEKIINPIAPPVISAPVVEAEPEHHPCYSPSSLERIASCPGSVRMSQGLPPLPESEDATEGTLLHYAISRERKPDLTSEQMELIDRCNALVTELRGEDGRVYREERISVMGSNFEEITFGTCDVLMVKSDRVILIDWKFGRKEVGEAANNLQLAAYAVGAAQIHGVDTVECHVFQPRINHHSTYAFTDIPAVLSSIEELIEISNAPVWTFNPSEKTCQYCRAKFVCKPCLSALQQLPAIAQGTDLALAAAMPDLIARAKQAAKIADAVLDKAKAMLTEGHEIPGYFLKPGNEVRKVTDIAKAFELIKDFISYEDYLKLCTVPPAKLEEVFIQAMKAASPEMSKKDAEAKFSELMRPVICKSQNAPSLAVDKKRGKNEK